MEGATGVIYKICFKLETKKEIRTSDILSFQQINDVVASVRTLKQNPNVSMIEFLDKQISEWLGLSFKYHWLWHSQNLGREKAVCGEGLHQMAFIKGYP